MQGDMYWTTSHLPPPSGECHVELQWGPYRLVIAEDPEDGDCQMTVETRFTDAMGVETWHTADIEKDADQALFELLVHVVKDQNQ